jgi:hypothetical protein
VADCGAGTGDYGIDAAGLALSVGLAFDATFNIEFLVPLEVVLGSKATIYLLAPQQRHKPL